MWWQICVGFWSDFGFESMFRLGKVLLYLFVNITSEKNIWLFQISWVLGKNWMSLNAWLGQSISLASGGVFLSDKNKNTHPRTFILNTHKLHVLEMLLLNFCYFNTPWWEMMAKISIQKWAWTPCILKIIVLQSFLFSKTRCTVFDLSSVGMFSTIQE